MSTGMTWGLDEIYKTVQKIQVQLNQMRDDQVDSRTELVDLMNKGTQKMEAEIEKRTLHLQTLAEDRVSRERKIAQDIMATEEQEWRMQLQRLSAEKETMNHQVITMKERILSLEEAMEWKDKELHRLQQKNDDLEKTMKAMTQKQESLQLENQEVTIANAVMNEKMKVLNTEVEAETGRLKGLKEALKQDRERLDEDRLALAFDRATFVTEFQKITLEIKTLREASVTRATQGDRITEPRRPIPRPDLELDVACEAVDLNVDTLDYLEVCRENERLREELVDKDEAKRRLMEQVKTLHQEKINLEESLRQSQVLLANDEVKTIVDQFKEALASAKRKVKLQDLELALQEEREERLRASSAFEAERQALTLALSKARAKVEEEKSRHQQSEDNLRMELDKVKAELYCLNKVKDLKRETR